MIESIVLEWFHCIMQGFVYSDGNEAPTLPRAVVPFPGGARGHGCALGSLSWGGTQPMAHGVALVGL